MSLRELAQAFKPILVRHELEWTAERDSDPINVDHGKQILEKLCQDLLDLRTNIALEIQHRQIRPVGDLDEALKLLKTIQRHQVRLDGGVSFKEFWDKGNRIVNSIKSAVGEISQI